MWCYVKYLLSSLPKKRIENNGGKVRMWSSVVFTVVTINNILWFVTVINLSMLENKNILVELFDTALNADFCTFDPFQS